MKKQFLTVAAILAMFGAGCASTPSSPAPAPAPQPEAPAPNAQVKPSPTPSANTNQKKPAATVEIIDNAFSPKQLAIGVGDTVVWVNKGKWAHTVKGTGDVLLWDSGNLMPGQTYNRTFTEPGVYTYSCGIHPEMTGEIIVGAVQAQ